MSGINIQRPKGAYIPGQLPIGFVFISVVSTNPATLMGYGTWVAFSTGRILIGIDSGDTDFDTVEETGGSKTKTIAQANLPNISTGAGTAHSHTQDSHNHTQDAHTHTQNSHNHTQDAHSHSVTSVASATTGATTNLAGSNDTSSTTATAANATATNQAATATNQNATATNQATTATNQNESSHTHSLGGSGTALNIMPPTTVVYMFKRTA